MSGGFFDFRERLLQPSREAAADRGQAARPEPMSVTAVTGLIDTALKGLPSKLYVRGELSQCNRHRASGHLYLSIKDTQNCLDGVMFAASAAKLKFEPAAGMEVVLGGQIRVYGKSGRYQIYIEEILPVGTGALELAFRQLHAKLSREGLFDANRRKSVPPFVRRVAVITAARSAAMHDVQKVFTAVPHVRLAIFDSLVQGATAAARLIDALGEVERSAARLGVEAILIVRGGGSPEDLAAFSDEALARAVAACRLPTISGIGHEVNVSIVDLVADHHAHTPTEAAHFVLRRWKLVPEALDASTVRLRRTLVGSIARASQHLSSLARHEAFRRPADRLHRLGERLDHGERRLTSRLQHALERLSRRVQLASERLRHVSPGAQLRRRRERLRHAIDRLQIVARRDLRRHQRRLARLAEMLAASNPRPRLTLLHERVDTAGRRLKSLQSSAHERRRESLDRVEALLTSLSPTNVLRRGYSITSLKRGGRIVRSVADVPPGAALITRLADGEVESIARTARQPELFDSP